MGRSGSNRRVLVVSGDTLPLPGLPTTGAGLRAWGLGKGLESRGHEVHFLMPAVALERAAEGVDKSVYQSLTYDHLYPQALNRRIADLSPDVIVFQHWMSAVNLSERNRIPVVIDFHGPLVLETLYQDLPHLDQLRRLKIRTLPKADFFTCAGEQQRHYFYPWLMLAGFDVRDNVIQAIPVSLSPDLPARAPGNGDVTFVYGGVFLPWQDPSLALETLVETLEQRGSGCLKFFGGTHAHVDIPPGKYRELIPRLRSSPRVEVMGMVAHDALLQTYQRAHVAMDLMARNPERELAFTTRTVEYLWCGLPVVYNDYAELARYIREYDAGWTIDPQDARVIRSVIESILDDPSILEAKSRNAQRLTRERLAWDRTIEPLDAFCREPRKRAPNTIPSLLLSAAPDDLEVAVKRARADVRRARRSWPARLSALAREVARRALKRTYVIHLHGRPARVDGALRPGRCAGQSFQAEADNLNGIELLIGTFGRLNSCDVVLHVREASDAPDDLAVSTVNAMLMQDCAFCLFSFPAIPHSARRDFYFWVESPNAALGDCITVFRHVEDNSLVFSQRCE
ncbi:MAG TPA: glycosyltransferase family 4 protein [Anaerolineae bacterium]